jgi:hypothetical protein
VDVGLELAQGGYYHWAVRLFSEEGVDIGHSFASGTLSEGSASIDFSFSGADISATEEDGPYYVRSLLIYCDSPCTAQGRSITTVTETDDYSVDLFE